MLTSYPVLDSTFSNPVVFVTCPSLSSSSKDCSEHIHHHQLCFQLPPQKQEVLWPVTCHLRWSEDRHKPFCEEEVMNAIEPEEDLKRLIDNELKLRLSGYYYGNLSWLDASHMLKQCSVGTFLVRDSEHGSYLYSLSVQTSKGPTSCRIEYSKGLFKLDSSEDLSDKMPRFNSVTDLIDHYVKMTKSLPHKAATKDLTPVWLDLDADNSVDVPVQIYKPLYKSVRSLQHICRVNIVRTLKERYPSSPLSRAIEEHEYKALPMVLKDYLKEYPYPQ